MLVVIKGISKEVKELVVYVENDGVKVDAELVRVWIVDIMENLKKEDLLVVTRYLLTVGNDLNELLKVYSFVNYRFEEIVNA